MNHVTGWPGSTPDRTYIVEDHELLRSLLASWFAVRGHEVSLYDPSNPDALDGVEDHDLVVLDLCLGEKDGVDVLQHLSDRRFEGDVILISAFPESVIETARDLGADFGLHVIGTLRKPLLFERLDALLATARAPRRRTPPSSSPNPTLAEALADGRVTFHIQPILDASSLRTVSVEMLARLSGPAGDDFSIGAAVVDATADDLHELARIAVEGAEGVARDLGERGLEAMPIAINVPSSLVQRRLFGPIADRLRTRNLTVTFEVSELDPFDDLMEARRTTTSAVLHGLRFSLDDFGTVNSNIDRFLQIPFDELKLDRTYAAGCSGDPFRDAVCRCAIELAHLRGAIVVAEGVETWDDFEHLKEMGVDRVQGFLFAPPLPVDALADWIVARRDADMPEHRPETHNPYAGGVLS